MLPQEVTRLTQKHKAEDYEYIQPQGNEDLDKDALLFLDSHQEYKPEYLELPIKVEGDLRHHHKVIDEIKKLHESSIECSQSL